MPGVLLDVRGHLAETPPMARCPFSNVSTTPIRTAAWQILVADDDPSIQLVTRAALRHVTVAGRPLALSQAASVADARAWLAGNAEPALLLLDVGLDTDDAGLILAREVRQGLGNQTVRILLRSGRDPESLRASVVGLDVGDVLGKATGTLPELRAAIITALEAYARLTRTED